MFVLWWLKKGKHAEMTRKHGYCLLDNKTHMVIWSLIELTPMGKTHWLFAGHVRYTQSILRGWVKAVQCSIWHSYFKNICLFLNFCKISEQNLTSYKLNCSIVCKMTCHIDALFAPTYLRISPCKTNIFY